MPKPKTGAGRGAKPLPTEVHRARGNPSKKSLPGAPAPETALAVVVAAEVPPVPVWCDDYGSAVWQVLWEAGRRHLSEKHDQVLITMLVETMQERHRVREWLGSDTNNRWYTTANGQTVTHPAVKQIEQMNAQITAWLSMLGFSPSDRARLGLAEIRVANELDAFRQRKERLVTDVLDVDPQ